LARARGVSHPSDAILILTAAAEQRIGRKNRAAYREAAKLLVQAGTLFQRSGRSEDFRSYLGGLRAEAGPPRGA